MERVLLNREGLTVVLMKTKSKEPNNFISMAEDLHQVDDVTESGQSKELWLLQVPKGSISYEDLRFDLSREEKFIKVHAKIWFDVSSLKKLHKDTLLVSGASQTLKVKTEQEKKKYTVASFRDSSDYKNACMVVRDGSGQISLGGSVQNMVVVTEKAQSCEKLADSRVLEPKKGVPMPTGIRVRFSVFGADTPCPGVAGKSRKGRKVSSKDKWKSEKKKHKKGSAASDNSTLELLEPTADEESVTEDVSRFVTKSSKKRKRESMPDSCNNPSPQKKKRKNHSLKKPSLQMEM